MKVRFGQCLIDSETRELRVRGKPSHLTPKAFELLEVLLENRPKALAKTSIHEKLWPGTFVSDGTLTSLLAEVRAAIGDDGRKPRFIRTVHRFGYAFSAEANAEPDEPRPSEGSTFKLTWADREIALHEGENILGRGRDAVAWIDVHSVSRHHARIVVSGDSATIEDLRSKNGTYLGRRRLASPHPLSDGDRIRIGTVEMTFRRYSGGVSTESALSQ